MRTDHPIDALMPRTRQRVLAATVLQPERWWYLSDLAAHLGVRPSSLQRELAGLSAAGILTRRPDGGRVYYRAEPACPFLDDLRGLLLKTVGLVDVLRDLLTPHGKRIRFAAVYGSIARGEETSGSDVDLLVVGRLQLSKLAMQLRDVEQRLGREINPTVYTEKEVTSRLSAGDHFLSSVMREPLIAVIGDRDELEQLAGTGSHQDSSIAGG